MEGPFFVFIICDDADDVPHDGDDDDAPHDDGDVFVRWPQCRQMLQIIQPLIFLRFS
jgi:hypothetical protein